jgi:diguanylate cyclase (GGDEF)-like protein
MQMAELEYGRAVVSGERLGVIMLDIDNFKQINDQHGNLVGDDVLKSVADRLSRHVREKSALIARFDGDEFCVMLKIRSLRSLYKLADELRISIGSDPVTSAPIVVKVTMSAGICHIDELTAYPENLREFLNLANQALLEAKAHGRNLVWPEAKI